MKMDKNRNRIKSLSIWNSEIEMEPLSGGITNINFLVTDGDRQCVVRLGDDIIEHQIMRFNELAASKAAHDAGLSPKVLHSETGILVLEYIPSKPLDEEQVRDVKNLGVIISLIRKCHTELPKYLRGPALMFWVFHVLRDYGWTLREGDSAHVSRLPDLLKIADVLESASGPHEMVFGHNDLLAANIIDDGKRLWLLDWDYAGFNSPLFDLGGLASNNGFDENQEIFLLETYFEQTLNDGLWHRYQAMKCASLLRETMWSMVSEIHSEIEFDYAAYTHENLTRFEQAYDAYRQS